jgi:hypothetical protein
MPRAAVSSPMESMVSPDAVLSRSLRHPLLLPYLPKARSHSKGYALASSGFSRAPDTEATCLSAWSCVPETYSR